MGETMAVVAARARKGRMASGGLTRQVEREGGKDRAMIRGEGRRLRTLSGAVYRASRLWRGFTTVGISMSALITVVRHRVR